MSLLRTSMGAGLLAAAMLPAHAIEITSTGTEGLLEAALLSGPGIAITSSTLAGQGAGPTASSGTYLNASGLFGIGPGIVLSSGAVADCGDAILNSSGSFTTAFGVGATGPQEALLDSITGGGLDHFDVTQFDLTFDAGAATDTIFFNVVFGSDEFPEFVGTTFIDRFGIFLNDVNIAVFDGLPININHPEFNAVPGTELDDLLDPTDLGGDPIMLFTAPVVAGSTGNTLTFIIADTSDALFDSTVYLSGFGNEDPGGGAPGGGVPVTTTPEPSTLALLGLGLVGLGTFFRRRKS